jgi:hypothetical protein
VSCNGEHFPPQTLSRAELVVHSCSLQHLLLHLFVFLIV